MLRMSLVLLLVVTGCSQTAPQKATDRPTSPSQGAPAGDMFDAAVDAGAGTRAEGPLVVQFRERSIDLEPFLIGQPYSRLQPKIEDELLFYFEKTATGTWLLVLDLPSEGKIDLSKGRRIGTTDWSTRSYWGSHYHAPSNRLFVTSDEANDEHTNVYAIDVDTGEIDKLTDNDYTYGWRVSDDDRRLAYLARTGETEPFDTCLVVRDLESGEETRSHCDAGGKDRFTWCSPQFTADQQSVIATIQHDGQRNTTSLARVAINDDSVNFIVPPRVARYDLDLIDGWPEPGVALYVSSETGFTEIYRVDVASGVHRKLTDFQANIVSTKLLETEPPTILAVVQTPVDSTVHLLDAATGADLQAIKLPARVSISDVHGDQAILSMGSLLTPFQFARLSVERGQRSWQFEVEELVGIDDALRNEICHVVPERVTYPTFDLTTAGRPRRLHAFYLAPKNRPVDPTSRRVMITAFYGGQNSYRTEVNILAAAGIAVMSPAPRGSDGFGAEFAALNDGDLGGDEIVDIIAAAEWLVREMGYRPEQIGVYGGSHGGYATMRALTFPSGTNNRHVSFNFGFGWSHAGFSDIHSFYESCNIPDWVVKEAGDPKLEADKLRDRSPIHHVENLRAPILLTHGSNDWRVPVEESRKFVEKARALGKPVHYVEFEGQGHGIRGFANQAKYYQAVLSFIESLDEPGE